MRAPEHVEEALRDLQIDRQRALRGRPLDDLATTLDDDPEPEPKPEPPPDRRKPCCVKHMMARSRAERRAAMGSCRCRGECGHHGKAATR